MISNLKGTQVLYKMPTLVQSWGLALCWNIWTTFSSLFLRHFLQGCDVSTMRRTLCPAGLLLLDHYPCLSFFFFFFLLSSMKSKLEGSLAQALVWDCNSGLVQSQSSWSPALTCQNLSIYFESVLLMSSVVYENDLWSDLFLKLKMMNIKPRLFIKNGFLSSFLYFLNYINGILIITNTHKY